jgi:hypothetical protein
MAQYKVVDAEQLDADLKIVAVSIREKGGTSEDLEFPRGFADAVGAIDTSKEEQEKIIDITVNGTRELVPDEGKVLNKVTVNVDVASSGGSVVSVEEKDVTFIDYDGTYVASYTLEEVATLTELPPAPDHTDIGLTFQEWNWRLDEIKEFGHKLFVGANYITTDGKTRIHFTLDDERFLNPSICFVQSVANGVTIDWGDGSPAEISSSVTGSAYTPTVMKIAHQYPSVGSYVITLECTAGVFWFVGTNNTAGGYMYDVLILPERQFVGNFKYIDTVTELEIGDGCKGITCRSKNLNKLNVPSHVEYLNSINYKSVIVPRLSSTSAPLYGKNPVIASISANSGETTANYSNTFNLSKLTLPNYDGVSIKLTLTHTNVAELYIPASVTSFERSCFQESSIKRLSGMEGLTSIGTNAFYNSKLISFEAPVCLTAIGQQAFDYAGELSFVKITAPQVFFGNSAFRSQSVSNIRYYDFTNAIVIDGVLSYTFGTNVFANIGAGTKIMFATKEIADVAKETTNLTAYADYIHYLGEEDEVE